jgi:xylan 1,4-beta-xylosidase
MTPFHGGFGLLNYEDLAKPSYFAYQFLNRLGPDELECRDPAAFVCRGPGGAVQALFWDFTITHPGPSVIDQVYYKEDHPSAPKPDVELRLARLAPGTYRMVAYKVGYRANDVQAAWRDLGSPAQLTRHQVKILREASSGRPSIDQPVTVGADGQFSRTFAMRENDVWLVELRPQGPSR